MKKFHCLETLFKTKFSNNKSYHSHLFLKDNKIEILIYCSNSNFINQFMNWFGQDKESENILDYIDITVSEKENDLINISIENSKIISITSEQYDDTGKAYFTIIFDQVILYKKPLKNENSYAKIYLNDDGFDLVKGYYSIFTGFFGDGKFDIIRMKGMDEFYNLGNCQFRPEFEYNVSDKRDSRNPEIEKIPILKFQLSENSTQTEIINYLNIACKICSFYLGNNIEFSKGLISLKEHRVIIRKTLETKFTLNINSLNWIMTVRGIHEFLKLNWQEAYLKNQNKLDKAITNYTHSRLLDSNSKFMLLYNIIDICMGGFKPNSEKFKVIVSKREKNKNYNNALEILKKNIAETDITDFEIKWESAIRQLIYKPMKSTLSDFFNFNKIDIENLEVSINSMKEIRDEIFHGRVNDEMQELINKSNIQLFRITPILILNLLNIKDWEQIND